jgi:enamine deaminase RidA (YjgF/YER057c/UK114 family)
MDQPVTLGLAAAGLNGVMAIMPLGTATAQDAGNIVSTTVFLKDLNEFGKMNEVYATFFNDKPPARATVEVVGLPRGVKIEVSAIAFQP